MSVNTPKEHAASRANDWSLLFSLVKSFVEETQPHRKGSIVIKKETSLDSDLAIDSLGKIELLGRVEEAFGCSITEEQMAKVEKVFDLIALLENIPLTKGTVQSSEKTFLHDAVTVPEDAKTLIEVLDWHADNNPDRLHVNFVINDFETKSLTYLELRDISSDVSSGLQRIGLSKGQTVGIMLPNSLDFFFAFFGVLLAGGVPVPIYPPARANQIEDHLIRHSTILANAESHYLITVSEAKGPAQILKIHAKTINEVVTVSDLRVKDHNSLRPKISETDLAFLQYTSGSTGDPKGVMLTHKNLLANIRAMSEPFDLSPDGDVFVSWLPLYHDMGLIGAWLCSLYYAMPLVLMTPQSFISRPERWLQAIHKYGGTISASPNFGYELTRVRAKEEKLKNLDLSSWRISVNGAEAVLSSTIDGFNDRFGKYGLLPTVIRPVYGLAENSVGLAFPSQVRTPIVDRIDRLEFSRSGRAIPDMNLENLPLEFVSCGQPLPKHEIRVVDSGGREVSDRQEGSIEFRGPSSTQGYYHNKHATQLLFNGDWLVTGDKGYLAGGEIYITGRVKDTIIRAGRNIYAAEVEVAVGSVVGVRTGCVAVFGVHSADSSTEELVVMAETRIKDNQSQKDLIEKINKHILSILGEPADQIVLVAPFTVLKTSSGKIRRNACKDLYISGDHVGNKRPVWLQFLRLCIWSIKPEILNLIKKIRQLTYACWWWLCAIISFVIIWPAISLIPNRNFCHMWSKLFSKVFLICTGASPTVDGIQNIPIDGPLLISSNHTSYLDPVLIIALMPRNIRFVAKNTLEHSPFGLMLKNLGTIFVERFDFKLSSASTSLIIDAVSKGEAVVIFPEGTFGRMSGLLPFKMGAFLTATETNVPVLPVALKGLRSALRSESWYPRYSKITLSVGHLVIPESKSWDSALILKDKIRSQIIHLSGEADLRSETGEINKLRPEN